MRQAIRVSIVAAALCLALPAGGAGHARAAGVGQEPQVQGQQPPGGKPRTPGRLTMDCDELVDARRKVATELNAMDARLEELVAKMNDATGQPKLEATAEVVTELVRQRKAMRDTLETMHLRMLQHVGEHLRAGGPEALMKCPMMQMKPAK